MRDLSQESDRLLIVRGEHKDLFSTREFFQVEKAVDERNDKRNAILIFLLRSFHNSPVDDHHLIDLGFSLAIFKSLVCHDTPRVHVEIEESDTSYIAAVASVASKPGATAVAHPKRRLLFCVLIQHTVVIDMITGEVTLATNTSPMARRGY